MDKKGTILLKKIVSFFIFKKINQFMGNNQLFIGQKSQKKLIF